MAATEICTKRRGNRRSTGRRSSSATKVKKTCYDEGDRSQGLRECPHGLEVGGNESANSQAEPLGVQNVGPGESTKLPALVEPTETIQKIRDLEGDARVGREARTQEGKRPQLGGEGRGRETRHCTIRGGESLRRKKTSRSLTVTTLSSEKGGATANTGESKQSERGGEPLRGKVPIVHWLWKQWLTVSYQNSQHQVSGRRLATD